MGMDRIGISNIFFPKQEGPSDSRRKVSRSKRRSTQPFDLTTITTPKDPHPLARVVRRFPHSVKKVFKKFRRKKQDKFAAYRPLAPYYQEIFESEDDTFIPDKHHTLAPPMTKGLSSSNSELFFERKEDVFQKVDLAPRPLICRGKLLHDKSGMVYLKVDPRFITLHAPLIPGARPPQGEARIPIISAEESKRNHLWGHLPELGRNFYFGVEGTYEVSHPSDPALEKSYLFKIESDSLEALRRSHTLAPKPSPSGFYLTFATKRRQQPVKLAEAGYFRVHPGHSAV